MDANVNEQQTIIAKGPEQNSTFATSALNVDNQTDARISSSQGDGLSNLKINQTTIGSAEEERKTMFSNQQLSEQ